MLEDSISPRSARTSVLATLALHPADQTPSQDRLRLSAESSVGPILLACLAVNNSRLDLLASGLHTADAFEILPFRDGIPQILATCTRREGLEPLTYFSPMILTCARTAWK